MLKSNRLLPLAAVLVLAACTLDGALSVETTDRIPGAAIEDPRNIQLTLTSAIADFECAFANYIAATGLLGDELADAQLDLRAWDYDRRTIRREGTPLYAVAPCEETIGPGLYQPLQTARFMADTAIRLLQSPKFVAANIPNRRVLFATFAAYSGYSHLLLGEAMCQAAVDGGPALTSQQMLQLAEQKFTLAIDSSAASGPTDIANMARIGRARARLDLGKNEEAVLDADSVPRAFRKLARYSSQKFRSSNRIALLNNRSERATVEDSFRAVTHMGVKDPRVRVERVIAQGKPKNGLNGVPLFRQLKYAQPDSPIAIARYEEAQLIIAEVRGGATAVDIINELHKVRGLGNFAATDRDVILRHVIEERKLELFLESQQFYDKLRFNKLLDPDPLPDTHPAGTAFIMGGKYGALECLPLPDVERLNRAIRP